MIIVVIDDEPTFVAGFVKPPLDSLHHLVNIFVGDILFEVGDRRMLLKYSLSCFHEALFQCRLISRVQPDKCRKLELVPLSKLDCKLGLTHTTKPVYNNIATIMGCSQNGVHLGKLLLF